MTCNTNGNGFAKFLTDFRTLLAIFCMFAAWGVRAELHMGDDTEYVPKTEIELQLSNLKEDHKEMKEELRELRSNALDDETLQELDQKFRSADLRRHPKIS